jgi:serine protease Do
LILVGMVAGFVLAAPVGAQTRDRDVAAGLFMQLGRGAEIGASVREVAADEVSRAKLERAGGVYVVDVREGGPAARAGVRRGDIIAAFDGERVRSVRQFSRLVADTPPGRTVQAEIVRDGVRQALAIMPEAVDGPFAGLLPEIRREIERGIRTLPPDLPMPPGSPGARGARARLGVTLTPLTDQLATYFGVKNGVLVSAIEPESPAAQAGLRAGDVLTAIDGRAVRTPADVTASVRSAPRDAALDVRFVRDRKETSVTVTVDDRSAPSRQIAI